MSARKYSGKRRPNFFGGRPNVAIKKNIASVARKSSAPKRRRKSRGAGVSPVAVVAVTCFIAVTGVIFYVLWSPDIRIKNITAEGFAEQKTLRTVVLDELKGTYAYVIPRDSFFFYPEHKVQAAILREYPDMIEVSVVRSGFNTISITGEKRVSSYFWCGDETGVYAKDDTCYLTDRNGLVFSKPKEDMATSSMLRVRAKLTPAPDESSAPLTATVVGASGIPAVRTFIEAIQSLGTPIASVTLRKDEVDVYTSSGTRLTYVSGEETSAIQDAKTALPTLNLVDGSIIYVDLRFPGKVYLKRTAE